MTLPMSTPKEVNGIDTIFPLTKMPDNPKLSYNTVAKQTILSKEWINQSIAMLPFCMKDKVPLIWHTNPGSSLVLFSCPICGTVWKRDRKWNEDKAQFYKEAYGGK